MSRADADNREIRDTVEGLELRAAADGSTSPGTIVGYAAVFNRYSLDLGYFRETIAPGAFAKALQFCDVRAVVNHEPALLIGRASAGTLRLAEDAVGLRVEIDLPDTTTGRDVAESIRRRDMQGQSFMFTTSIDQWDWSGETPIRTIIEVDELFEIGPVTFPAYEETSVALRAFKGHAAANEAPPSHRVEAERCRRCLRLLEVS